MACENSADICILWWIFENKLNSSGPVGLTARMPEILYLAWCEAPSAGRLPPRHPADLRPVLSAPLQPRLVLTPAEAQD